MTSAKHQSHVTQPASERKRVADLLARAERNELVEAFEAITDKPAVQPVRGPETGLVMVRGRIGGGGASFNLGEVTVTRATMKLGSGAVGHAQALGTDREKARLAAIFDALWQDDAMKDFVEERLLLPIAARIAGVDRRKADETAATRVDFFTMVRGDD
ncbi:phosphonate metabolism protein PhnG [Rhizobium etli 8C-3]|uniref:Alpha-D-ribose 1-methylphosphonate 5-triphosphate synthase subunit PhnG n=2 Tax=Rhizobium TaxID=379 RepID=A0A4R3RVH8_9HYPH|nr:MULTISPECIES: phosphonate C-P lyase system protein PhnG [Rhizobium]APO73054.1 phosphonate metabolism protein PhnG [Rhizobium etli 8C-3]TCU26841.1 alpha-D-ribose 1-methylphosphonate 5-triphosphate synthase subunit PhnG [Rhizobium azibense]TCU38787.1 alpha-D-ribose 1-methylphosphonate 5-triphosphate synthase subunit PhnG [Rhizobium azibense]